jgi:hypothetical protein
MGIEEESNEELRQWKIKMKLDKEPLPMPLPLTPEETIAAIVDCIEAYGKKYMTHPNDTAKLYAVSRLVDAEVIKRMEIINERNSKDGTIFVGHCGNSDL